MIYVLSDRSCRFVHNIALFNGRALLTNSRRTLILKLYNYSKFNKNFPKNVFLAASVNKNLTCRLHFFSVSSLI